MVMKISGYRISVLAGIQTATAEGPKQPGVVGPAGGSEQTSVSESKSTLRPAGGHTLPSWMVAVVNAAVQKGRGEQRGCACAWQASAHSPLQRNMLKRSLARSSWGYQKQFQDNDFTCC